ncbi:hypothetical protein GRI89_17090 [Altererythrobacter salegens]|uniref:Uncharacterized protein n=1 Tax=Croceibacterium salegens TaxID=1737568 RepID=A0A6I4T3E7_9SPHN|nr:hypothetical protein [Croceibacterium salegens]MXO61262.1 hypothetical protein [Croceibacterium salegens]
MQVVASLRHPEYPKDDLMRLPIALAAPLMAGACAAIQPAEMRVPQPLIDQSVRLPVEGIGGWNHGRFRTGDYAGDYERSEERLAFLDAVVRNSGHSGFVIKGPGISSTIEADCRMRERVLDFGVVEFTPRRMSYRCEFTADGRAIPARFELQEVRTGLAGALSRRERRGEIALGGEKLEIRSVHKLAGSPIEMATPIGYVFEQDGHPVGAVEINGQPVIYISDLSDEGLSRTITVGALALAVFRDPANSALGD